MIFWMISVLFFSQAPPCWMMVWKIISEAWYLNINFPRGSTITYRLSISCVDPLRFYLLQPFTYDLSAMCRILVLNFSFTSYWVSSHCLNKHCSALMTSLVSHLLTFAVIGLIKHTFQHNEMALQTGLVMTGFFSIPLSQLKCSVNIVVHC